jgi:hypothetical protein
MLAATSSPYAAAQEKGSFTTDNSSTERLIVNITTVTPDGNPGRVIENGCLAPNEKKKWTGGADGYRVDQYYYVNAYFTTDCRAQGKPCEPMLSGPSDSAFKLVRKRNSCSWQPEWMVRGPQLKAGARPVQLTLANGMDRPMSVELRSLGEQTKPLTGCVAPRDKTPFPAPSQGYVLNLAVRSDGRCGPIDQEDPALICAVATFDFPRADWRDAELMLVPGRPRGCQLIRK